MAVANTALSCLFNHSLRSVRFPVHARIVGGLRDNRFDIADFSLSNCWSLCRVVCTQFHIRIPIHQTHRQNTDSFHHSFGCHTHIQQRSSSGATNSWNLTGIFSTINLPGGNWPYALLINTSYLYLLFFGFQEIQAMEREIQESSKIPIVSWIKKDFVLNKTKYVSWRWLTVVTASLINIFYALAVYASHPDITSLQSAQIPALYLAQNN